MDKFLTLGVVERLKNSDFILEIKMVELNQKKNSKQRDRPDAVCKLYFTLFYLILLFTPVLQSRSSKRIRKFARKLSS